MAGPFKRVRKHCITLNEPRLKGHQTFREYRDGLAALGQSIQDYEVFSAIRNPFAWQVSWFTYIRAPKGGRRSGYYLEHDLFQKMEFPDYVEWLLDPDSKRSDRFEMGRQVSDWVVDDNGDIAVETILRQEQAAADLAAMIEKYGLRLSLPQKPVNVSNKKDYRTFYTPAAVDAIAQKHARDLELFGYTFE